MHFLTRAAIAAARLSYNRDAVAYAATEYADRLAASGKSSEDVLVGLLGIDNNFRFKSGPRKGQHKPGTLTARII